MRVLHVCLYHVIGSECSSDIRSLCGVTALRRHGWRPLYCCMQERNRQEMVNWRATLNVYFHDLLCYLLRIFSSPLPPRLIRFLPCSLSLSCSCLRFTFLTAFSYLFSDLQYALHFTIRIVFSLFRCIALNIISFYLL